MVSVGVVLREAHLPGDSARLEAELLLCHCIGESRTYLYTHPERELSDSDVRRFDALLDARRQGRPVAYLTGRREFWTLDLEVDSQTLIPRPETELLVEWALDLTLPDGAWVADWGTGSGAIALALASERPGWNVLASDRSPGALAVAQRNRQSHDLDRVALLQGDWGDAIAQSSLSLIVSNPPYVAEGDSHLEQGDLRFEPGTALVAGSDGLSAIRNIIRQASRRLRPGGWLLFEHGHDQGAVSRELLSDGGFAEVSTRPDLAGLDRVSGGCLP